MSCIDECARRVSWAKHATSSAWAAGDVPRLQLVIDTSELEGSAAPISAPRAAGMVGALFAPIAGGVDCACLVRDGGGEGGVRRSSIAHPKGTGSGKYLGGPFSLIVIFWGVKIDV